MSAVSVSGRRRRRSPRPAGTSRPRARGGPAPAASAPSPPPRAARRRPVRRCSPPPWPGVRAPGRRAAAPSPPATAPRGDRRERPLSGAPVRGVRAALGGQVTAVMGTPRLHSMTWSMKSSRPWSAWWRSSKTITTGELAASRSKKRAPGREQLVRPDAHVDAQQGQELPIRSSPAPMGPARARERSRRSAARVVPRRRPPPPGSPTHHLAQGPEGDAVAIGRAATGMPPDAVQQAVQVLEELPGQTRLADAARADDAHQARPPLPAGGLEEVLELAELLVPTDERCLERVAPVLAAPLGDHPDGPPCMDRSVLALELVLAGVLEDDGARRRSLGRLADQHRPGCVPPTATGEAVLTMSPATMPWLVAPMVTAASPVRMPARAWMPGPRVRTASTRSSPARTARSASSSWATGAPHTAITASPMNFSTLPPYCPMTSLARSK